MFARLTLYAIVSRVAAVLLLLAGILKGQQLFVLPQPNQEFAFGGVSGNTLPEEHP